MNAEEGDESDENEDVVDLDNYNANKRSHAKRGKTLEDDGKLLTSRGNPRES